MDYKLDYNNINKKLSHLSHEEIEKLIERYYAGEKIKELARDYNLGTSVSNLHTLFPSKICLDNLCPYCNVQMVLKFESRTKSYYSDKENPRCPNCRHEFTSYCRCYTCESKRFEERKRILMEKATSLKQYYDVSKYKPISLDSLDLSDKIYLGALLRSGLSEDLTHVKPYETFDVKLSPTKELDFEIIGTLYEKNIIRVSSYSPLEAFKWDKSLDDFYMGKVSFHINVVQNEKEYKEIIKSLMNPDYELSSGNAEVIYKIWRCIAYYECVEFLMYNMDLLGFNYSIGDKTKATIEDLLNTFSVSQVFNFIYNGTNNALRYYEVNKGKISKNQASNTFISYCQKRAERHLANNIPVYYYNRGKCYQSVLSEFFFNRIIKIGDGGFNKKPGILEKKVENV